METGTAFNTSLESFKAALHRTILTVEEKNLAIDILEGGFANLFVLVGLLGNVLTVIVFYKMGYKDTINISMTFICSLDFLRCLFVLIYGLHYPLRLLSPVYAATWYGIGKVTFSFFANIGSYISNVLAAYVSLERCLCVSIPFTVKYLLTPRLVLINNFIISLIVTGAMLLFYTCYTYVWVFNPELNATIPIQGLRPFFFKHPEMNVYMTVVGAGLVGFSFVIIGVCTIIISYHLKKASKFKASATAAAQKGNDSQISGRDRQVMKMLLVIIAVYIGVNIPRILFYLVRVIFPEIDLQRKEENIYLVLGSLVNTIDHINPATNLFIVYSMSSQFKKAFDTMFRSPKI